MYTVHGTTHCRANLTRTSEEVSHYYVKHFLPLCVELCRPNATASDKASTATTDGNGADSTSLDGTDAKKGGTDVNSSSGETDIVSKAGTAGSSGAGTDASDQLSFFPDPTRDVSEHSPVARGVAYIFLKRQQVTR